MSNDMIKQGKMRPTGFKTPSKRQLGLILIREDYAKHGQDTGIATRSMIEYNISRNAYNHEAQIGLDIKNNVRLNK